MVADRPEWVELDLRGNLIGRWSLGQKFNGGMAYTADGRLFVKTWDRKSNKPLLLVFDRTTASWTPVSHVPDGLLLGADGNDLVFAEESGTKLVWVRPPP